LQRFLTLTDARCNVWRLIAVISDFDVRGVLRLTAHCSVF